MYTAATVRLVLFRVLVVLLIDWIKFALINATNTVHSWSVLDAIKFHHIQYTSIVLFLCVRQFQSFASQYITLRFQYNQWILSKLLQNKRNET